LILSIQASRHAAGNVEKRQRGAEKVYQLAAHFLGGTRAAVLAASTVARTVTCQGQNASEGDQSARGPIADARRNDGRIFGALLTSKGAEQAGDLGPCHLGKRSTGGNGHAVGGEKTIGDCGHWFIP